MANDDTQDQVGLFATDTPTMTMDFSAPRPLTYSDMLEGYYRQTIRGVVEGTLVGMDATASSFLDFVFGAMTPRLAARLNNLANWCDRQVERERRAREEQRLADYSPFDAEET